MEDNGQAPKGDSVGDITETRITSSQNVAEIVKEAIAEAISTIKTDLTNDYQKKISEAVKASQARLIRPQEVAVEVEDGSLDFVKKVFQEDELMRQQYGKHVIDTETDLLKAKILTVKAAFPNLTPEEIHRELFMAQ